MKIAILGSRGIPVAYGGFETLVEELAVGLVGFDDTQVMVYCRTPYFTKRPATHKGVRLVYLPAPKLKAVESLLHSFLSSLHVLFQKSDVVYFVDPANAPFCVLLRLCGQKIVVHTDGLGWKRRKWGPLAQRYYKWVEWLCARTANALVTDNPTMEAYYRSEYNAGSTYIAYGASNGAGIDERVYGDFGLAPGLYNLVVARLEPENNVDFILAEYARSKVRMPLVVVGDSPYDASYLGRVRELANEQVKFTGRVNDQAKLNALYKGANLYIHGHEVGGTNPSLLRAMYMGTTPVVLDVPFNTSVVADCGFAFEKKGGVLAGLLERLVADPRAVAQIREKARARADTHFTWETVVARHHELFQRVAEGVTSPPRISAHIK